MRLSLSDYYLISDSMFGPPEVYVAWLQILLKLFLLSNQKGFTLSKYFLFWEING